MAGISPDHLHSPTGIGIATESHKDHLVGVAEEHANDRSIGIADEHAEDHLIGVTEDHDQDHVVGIGNDASNEHLLAISNEGLHDTHAALPTDTVEDHHASVAKDKFEDHHVAVAATEPVEPIPLFVSSNDDFPDDHMEIEAPPEEAINTQALTDEALVDHIEHVKEGKAKLAEAHLSADVPAPLLTPQAKPVTQPKQPQLVKKAPAVLTPEMVKQQQEALLARQHKMEEFHGRVDAIRKTVNDINSKLDHISPQEKKPH
jgi:polyhydroxyalkanoate synthesis regulator phasin